MTVRSWLASCAAISQSGTSIDRYDPAATSHPLWAERFSEFSATGAFTSGTTNAPSVTKTLSRFIPGEPWRVGARNATYNGDYARVDIEFLAGASVVLAVSFRSPASFKNVVYVGDTLGSMTAKASTGANPSVDGMLIASADGVRYTPNPASASSNTNAFFHAKDLSSVTAVRFGVQAVTGYTATLTAASFGYVQIMGRLKGTVVDSTGTPAARTVIAVEEATADPANSIVKRITSDAVTGAYSMPTDYGGAHSVIAYPASGEDLQAIILNGVTPV